MKWSLTTAKERQVEVKLKWERHVILIQYSRDYRTKFHQGERLAQVVIRAYVESCQLMALQT